MYKIIRSFGTIGTIEGAFFLKNGGNLVRLSQQALIDCSWGYGNNGESKLYENLIIL